MGKWQLEVWKMGLYMMFPVGLFHYFNEPKYYEAWVIEKRREIFPPETDEDRKLFELAKREYRELQESKYLTAYEAKNKAV